MAEFISYFAPLMIQYKKYKQASQKWSNSLESRMKTFDNFCCNKYPDSNQLTQELLVDYFHKRDSETINSCRTRCDGVAAFIKYLQRRNLTDLIIPELPKKQGRIYIPHAFTENELKRFFDGCDNLHRIPRRLDLVIRSVSLPVIFRLIYSAGMRTIEARVLKCKNIDLEHGIVNICDTKGYNEHYVVLHETMLGLMSDYDDVMEKLLPNREYFFSSRDGKHFCHSWLTQNFRVIWNSVNSSYATAYDLRHHYATTNINRWTDEGFDFYDKMTYLSKNMGHVCLESTKYYYSIVPGLSSIIETLTQESFDWIVPEVNADEEIN